jgi:hypothetical protein
VLSARRVSVLLVAMVVLALSIKLLGAVGSASAK